MQRPKNGRGGNRPHLLNQPRFIDRAAQAANRSCCKTTQVKGWRCVEMPWNATVGRGWEKRSHRASLVIGPGNGKTPANRLKYSSSTNECHCGIEIEGEPVMRPYKSTVVLAVLGLLAIAGCVQSWGNTTIGSGTAKTQKYDVTAFKAIKMNLGANMDISVGGDTTEVVLAADDNLIPLVTVKVDGDTLVLSSDESFSTRSPMKFTIRTPHLEALSISGSSDATIQGLHDDRLDIQLSGSGSVKASGTVQKLDANISGSGKFQLADVTASDATIHVSGSGEATVNATKSLNVHISGSGDIRYKPAPGLSIDQHVSGSGRVHPM
jgi:hypothetical protein